jgi:hypothetical protein
VGTGTAKVFTRIVPRSRTRRWPVARIGWSSFERSGAGGDCAVNGAGDGAGDGSGDGAADRATSTRIGTH